MQNAHRISRVTARAPSQDLTTLAAVKDELKLTDDDGGDDAYLGRALTAESAFIANDCNRVFPVQSYEDSFRVNDPAWPRAWAMGHRPEPLILANSPLISVGAIVEDGTALTEGADYEVDSEFGLIYRLDTSSNARNWWGRQVVVAYDSGFDPIPPDLGKAVLLLITHRYRARARDPYLRGETVFEVGSKEYWVWGAEKGIPSDIDDLISHYRIPLIG